MAKDESTNTTNSHTYTNFAEIVEGKKCHIVARKVMFKGMHRDPITNKPMVLYNLDYNCSVEMIQSLEMTDEEKSLRDALNVHYTVGDTLKAKAIHLYIDSKRNSLKFRVMEGESHRHGASVVDTNIRTIGKIQTPLKSYETMLRSLPKANVGQIEKK